MNQEHDIQTLEDKVLVAIRNGDVRMRPRWFFMLRAVLMGTGITILLFSTLYLASFIVFSLRQTGLWFAPSYGLHGLYLFLRALPWVLIAFSVLFVLVLELMVRHYSFAYRAPLAYSLLGVMVLVGFGAIIVAQTPLHGRIFIYSRGGGFTGKFYDSYLVHGDRVYHGKVMSSGDGFIIIKTFPEGVNATVTSDDAAHQDFIGTQVIIFGSKSDGVIRADQIHRAPHVEMYERGVSAPAYVQ